MDYKNKFPSLAERNYIADLGKFSKLAENNQMPVLGLHDAIKKQYKDASSIVYISHGIPTRIQEFYGDMVAGDSEGMTITFEDKAVQELLDGYIYENDIKESMLDYAQSQSASGRTWIHVFKDVDDTVKIQEVAADQVFPQKDGSIVTLTYLKDEKDPMHFFMLLQHFTLEGSNVKVSRTAWKSNEQGVATVPLELSVIANFIGKPDMQAEETIADNVDMLPFFKVSNGKNDVSDFARIVPQLAEINERVTQNATQFLKNGDAKMQLPAAMAEEDGKVKPFDFVLVDGKDQPEAKYITNSNPLIADAQEHILFELKMIELITGVPMWALTGKTQPEKVESLRLQLQSAIRKTTRKRSKLKRALQDALKYALMLDGTTIEGDVSIKFSDVLPTDETVAADTEVAKTQGGLSSKLSAIMRLNHCTEEEAQKELERINAENIMSGFTAPNAAPLQ